MTDLTVALYEKIQNDSEPFLGEIGGIQYSDKKLIPIYPPMPNQIHVATLNGLVDYVVNNVDELTEEELASLTIIVISPTAIHVCGKMDPVYKIRPTYLSASFAPPTFNFGMSYEIEEFIIALQSKFKMTENLAMLLTMVSSISDSEVKEASDDGITQSVVVTRGAKIKSRERVPNPITLQPIRSFYEIEPVESQFVFRLQKREDKLPKLLLIDGEAGSWEYETKYRIKAYLEENIDKPVSILV